MDGWEKNKKKDSLIRCPTTTTTVTEKNERMSEKQKNRLTKRAENEWSKCVNEAKKQRPEQWETKNKKQTNKKPE